MPESLQRVLDQTACVAGNFVPFGTYCLILGDAVRIIDSSQSPQLLQLTVQQLFLGAKAVGQSSDVAPMIVMQRLICDHRIAAYKTMLRNAISSMVPLLFMGGKIDDYQPKLVQRQTPNGEARSCFKAVVLYCQVAFLAMANMHNVCQPKLHTNKGSAASFSYTSIDVVRILARFSNLCS